MLLSGFLSVPQVALSASKVVGEGRDLERQPWCGELKGSLCVSYKYVFHQEIGLTLALELPFWESPGSFVTSHPLSKLLKLVIPLKKLVSIEFKEESY